MKLTIILICIAIAACGVKKTRELSMEERYMKMDTSYTTKEAFNDSICRMAVDSAYRRFKRNKFELYLFYNPDSSGTPIHLLREKFQMRVVGFAREDFVFKFCFNEAMIEAFENHHHFNPMDSVKVIYDSLLNIGQTQKNAEFPGGFKAYERYMMCNLEYPEGENLVPPYPFVGVSFRVSPNGYPDKIKVTESFSPEYDSAALKLIRTMPKWSPGQDDFGAYRAHLIGWRCDFDPTQKKKYCR